MVETQALTRFTQLLTRQAEEIEKLALVCSQLQHAVEQREWGEIEQGLRLVGEASERVERLEEERYEDYHRLVAACEVSSRTNDERVPFGRLLSHVPEPFREGLSRAHRALYAAVIRFRTRIAITENYLRASITTTRAILGEMYPEHTSSGYSARGERHFETARAVMIDRCL